MGETLASAQSVSTSAASGSANRQREIIIVAPLQTASQNSLPQNIATPAARTWEHARPQNLFFILIGIVNQDAVVVVGGGFQALVGLIPLRGNFIQEHHALAGETKLHVADLADKAAQPAGFFQ